MLRYNSQYQTQITDFPNLYNHIEGRIGNGKQAFSLNQIKAKLRQTSDAWIAITIFVMNLSVFAINLNAIF